MVEYQNIFGICAFDILWFRDHYVPKVEDRTNPEASPLLQNEKKAYEGMPQALVLVTELDPLKSEGELYAEKMRENGVAVTLKEYKGKYANFAVIACSLELVLYLSGIPHLGVYADGVSGLREKIKLYSHSQILGVYSCSETSRRLHRSSRFSFCQVNHVS